MRYTIGSEINRLVPLPQPRMGWYEFEDSLAKGERVYTVPLIAGEYCFSRLDTSYTFSEQVYRGNLGVRYISRLPDGTSSTGEWTEHAVGLVFVPDESIRSAHLDVEVEAAQAGSHYVRMMNFLRTLFPEYDHRFELRPQKKLMEKLLRIVSFLTGKGMLSPATGNVHLSPMTCMSMFEQLFPSQETMLAFLGRAVNIENALHFIDSIEARKDNVSASLPAGLLSEDRLVEMFPDDKGIAEYIDYVLRGVVQREVIVWGPPNG